MLGRLLWNDEPASQLHYSGILSEAQDPVQTRANSDLNRSSQQCCPVFLLAHTESLFRCPAHYQEIVLLAN
jgi:hypothetical protein